MRLLPTFLAKKAPKESASAPPVADGPPMPEQTTFVIGDLHGRSDLLERILEKIDAAIGAAMVADPRLVFVGDVIDRGPDSQQVLRRLYELTTEFPENVSCLLGNHEQMLLDFLDAPRARQSRWLRNGGAETMASFDLEIPEDPGMVDEAESLAGSLKKALGPELEDWLRELPVQIVSGNLHVVHAAIDPGRKIDDQSARVLVWGHPEFLTRDRRDGLWVAHGHTVMGAPIYAKGRISIDTGAWTTGTLSCAMITPDGDVDFLTAD